MSTPEIKKEIHDYVEGRIPKWHQSIIEKRLAQYEANPKHSISWSELKKKIAAMRWNPLSKHTKNFKTKLNARPTQIRYSKIKN